jgi:hypothetical protein
VWDREDTATVVIRSHGVLPILVANGLEQNQEGSSSRNKDGDDAPCLLALSQIGASGTGSPATRGPYGRKHYKFDRVGWCGTQHNGRQREGRNCKHARNLAKSTSECGGMRAGVDERVEAMAFLS